MARRILTDVEQEVMKEVQYDLARNGKRYAKRSTEQAVVECNLYVDALEARDALPPLPPLTNVPTTEQTLATLETFSPEHQERWLAAIREYAELTDEEKAYAMQRWYAAMDYLEACDATA